MSGVVDLRRTALRDLCPESAGKRRPTRTLYEF
jgi:hypothetical protein